MKTWIALSAFLVLGACSGRPGIKNTASKDSAANVTAYPPPFLSCILSGKDFTYRIDSCNCGDTRVGSDTVFVDLFQPDGGDIQGRFLKIESPPGNDGLVLLMKHQNRYFISSMGPDPLLTDWVLYNSPSDTIRYDSRKAGFYIAPVPEAEQQRFPKFDTLSFYKAYKRAMDRNAELDYIPDPAKDIQVDEYTRFQKNKKEIFYQAQVELHRIILELRQGSSVVKIIVFNYGHFG